MIFHILASSSRFSIGNRLTDGFGTLEEVNLSTVHHQSNVEDPAYKEIRC